MANRELLFSVTSKDCVFKATRGSGPGGQHRNKTSTAIRCIHPPSSAVGYSCDDKSQHRNKKRAFRRMAESEEMKEWIRLESARVTGLLAEIHDKIEHTTCESNLLIEAKDDSGRWKVIEVSNG